MAETVKFEMSGGWLVAHTNIGAVAVPITATNWNNGPDLTSAVRWAVRDDATLPAANFGGHGFESNKDRGLWVQPGETLFVRGQQSADFYLTVGE